MYLKLIILIEDGIPE